MKDTTERNTALKNLIEQLPQPNRNTFCHVIIYFHLLLKHADKNHFDRSKLSQVFSPIFLYKKSLQSVASSLSSSMGGTNLVEIILDQFLELAPVLIPPPPTPASTGQSSNQKETPLPIFGAPLADIMKRQQPTHPDLNIPLFMRQCNPYCRLIFFPELVYYLR